MLALLAVVPLRGVKRIIGRIPQHGHGLDAPGQQKEHYNITWGTRITFTIYSNDSRGTSTADIKSPPTQYEQTKYPKLTPVSPRSTPLAITQQPAPSPFKSPKTRQSTLTATTNKKQHATDDERQSTCNCATPFNTSAVVHVFCSLPPLSKDKVKKAWSNEACLQ